MVLDPGQRWKLLRGNCLDVLQMMPDNSIDAVVTDPPYGLSDDVDIRKVIRHWFVGKDYVHHTAGYMGAEWDSFVPGPEIWREVYRVLKPGGHLLAFSGSRTMDLMSFAIRFANFEMRDTILAWVYGRGKPKALDLSKAIDDAAGAEREVIARRTMKHRGYHITIADEESVFEANITAPATDAAKQWDGWSTGIKPAFEPVMVFRKPCEGRSYENVLKYGTGGMNADACRVPREPHEPPPENPLIDKDRWPPNVLLTHHPACVEDGECHPECVTQQLQAQAEDSTKFFPKFYYNGKATKEERYAYTECGCPGRALPLKEVMELALKPCATCGLPIKYERHPTVKPTNVMRWLIRLVCPRGGVVLDPFNGSGSTGVAALHERCRYVGIELGDTFYAIASKRLEDAAIEQPINDPPPVLRGIDEVVAQARTIPLPASEELRRAFDLTETAKLEKSASSLRAVDFKKLVAKGLKRR